MPKLQNGQVPKMRHHKVKGKTDHPGYAMVTIGGRDIHLGRWDDPKSEQRYNEEIAIWLSNGKKAVEIRGSAKTVDDLCNAWVAWAQEYYQKDGRPTTSAQACRDAARGVQTLFGSMDIQDFANEELELLQRYWIRQGKLRSTVNLYIRRVKKMFRWGVNRKFLTGAQWHEIAAVENVIKGRLGVADGEVVTPASEESIAGALKFASPKLAVMIQLQRMTGMRPGEVCMMRACDIDQTAEIWIYTPEHHKTEHHGKDRMIAIGPKAQAILLPWIQKKSDSKSYVFSETGRRLCDPASDYRNCVRIACERAGVEVFSPNQLRHAFATEILDQNGFDIKDAQVALGHSSYKTTERYAKNNLNRAAIVAAKLG